MDISFLHNGIIWLRAETSFSSTLNFSSKEDYALEESLVALLVVRKTCAGYAY